MSTPEQRLLESVNELLDGIHLTHDSNLSIPALILLYAGIDFVASLERVDANNDVTRSDFLSWVDKYLLPNSGLKCSAIDLYSARCAWVHTYTSKSRLIRDEKAKEILYQFGPHDNDVHLQNAVKDPSTTVAVHFTKLFNAFSDGLDSWREDFLGDSEHKARVLRNSDRLLHRLRLSF